MKGLRLTQIRSLGLDYSFNRYQLWECEIIPVQTTRRNLWLPGRIIHHFTGFREASEYLRGLMSRYDEIDIKLDPTNMEIDK